MFVGRASIMSSKEREEWRSYYDFCIRDLMFALEHVNQKYVRWTLGKTTKEDDSFDSTANNYCERVFAYELYHQFRRLMCDNDRYLSLLLNGEQQKDNSHFKHLLDVIKKEKIIPDLILHENMGTHEYGGQVLYVEIKTKDNENVFEDLSKLSGLAKTNLNFFYYVFIYVDGTKEGLIKKIMGDRVKRDYSKLDDEILCICIKEQKAECVSIKNLKKEIETIIKNNKE